MSKHHRKRPNPRPRDPAANIPDPAALLRAMRPNMQPPPAPPLPIVIYTAGSLAGEPMTAQQIASGIQGGIGIPGVRGVIQVIEAYAAEAMGMATYENAIRDGAAGPYLMAGSFLTNLLTDLREYAQGKVPSVPIQTRLRPRRPDPEKS